MKNRHPVHPVVDVGGHPARGSFLCQEPPADFLPDPGLVARIAAIRIDAPPAACPGQRIPTAYTSILDDGAELPFATSYDEDAPPDLHVVFLSRYSAQASALGGGDWAASPDALVSAVEGFHLRALLKAKPSVSAEVVVVPEYGCLDQSWNSWGRWAATGWPAVPVPT